MFRAGMKYGLSGKRGSVFPVRAAVAGLTFFRIWRTPPAARIPLIMSTYSNGNPESTLHPAHIALVSFI